MSVLAATCIFGTKENVSAKAKAVRPLSVNKKYYYNLDQKGAKEKVQVVKRVVTNENAKDYGWEYYSSKLHKVQTIGSVAKKKYKGLSYTHYVSENNAFLVDSKGKLTYKVCIKLKNNLDMVHFNDTLILKNGKFTTSKTKSFSLKDKNTYYIKIRTKNGKTGYIKNKEFKGTVNDRLHMSY